MAGMGWKRWVRERLTAAELQGYLQDQVIMRFDSASQRDAVLPESDLTDGMVCYLEDIDAFRYREAGGQFWRPLDGRWPNHTGDSAALPTTGAGARPGDVLYSESYECPLVFALDGWRQDAPAVVDGLSSYISRVQARGIASLPNGFMVMQSATNRLYVGIGGMSLMLAAGAPAGARVTSGFPAPSSGWAYVAGGITWARSVGNGIAHLYVELSKTTAALGVPVTGDLGNVAAGGVPSNFAPADTVVLHSGATGRVATGYLDTSGAITLAAVAPGADIAVGNVISLGGSYRLGALGE